MSRPPKNYRWWQDHGDGWRDEVAARKAYMPIYHLQEIFLEEYFARVAPAKVLEFGCGFGRHLEYLRRIPKLDVYGFDQSESMLEGMRWARPSWCVALTASARSVSTRRTVVRRSRPPSVRRRT